MALCNLTTLTDEDLFTHLNEVIRERELRAKRANAQPMIDEIVDGFIQGGGDPNELVIKAPETPPGD